MKKSQSALWSANVDLKKNSQFETVLKNRVINSESKPFVIAEIGINHGGSLKKALEIVRSASKTGCDAVKFQTYKAEKLSIKESPKFRLPNGKMIKKGSKILCMNSMSLLLNLKKETNLLSYINELSYNDIFIRYTIIYF